MRYRNRPRSHTIPVRHLSKSSLRDGRVHLQLLEEDRAAGLVPDRPVTRGDCANVPRPCPFVSCKHNLYLDVTSIGSIKLNFPDLDPDQMPAERSCVLDIADGGSATLDDVGVAMNMVRERARQIEEVAVAKMKLHGASFREYIEHEDRKPVTAHGRVRTATDAQVEAVLDEVLEKPGQTTSEVSASLGLARELVWWALRALRRRGVIASVRRGREERTWTVISKRGAA